MKIVLSVAEVQQAVAEYLQAKGFAVKQPEVKFETQYTGSYEDRSFEFVGASVEVDGRKG